MAKDSPRIGGLLNDLGLVLKHQGHYADAEQLSREPGDPRESLGHEHSSVGSRPL